MNALWLIFLLAAIGALRPPGPAGNVTGSFTLSGQPVALKHAYAHLSDNAEKLPGRKRELRILLSDRDVPSDSLIGAMFPPVWDLAREGAVKGMLIELDPANPNSVNIILLDKPKKEGQSLTNLSMSTTGKKLFREWNLTPARVAGALDRKEDRPPTDSDLPHAEFSVRFEAPVTREPPISADLKGTAALKSPQVAVLLARLGAMSRGDLAGIRALSTKRANRRIDSYPPEAIDQLKKMGKQMAAEQRRSLSKVQRVIVRGDRATVVLSKDEYATVVKEDGNWKADD